MSDFPTVPFRPATMEGKPFIASSNDRRRAVADDHSGVFSNVFADLQTAGKTRKDESGAQSIDISDNASEQDNSAHSDTQTPNGIETETEQSTSENDSGSETDEKGLDDIGNRSELYGRAERINPVELSPTTARHTKAAPADPSGQHSKNTTAATVTPHPTGIPLDKNGAPLTQEGTSKLPAFNVSSTQSASPAPHVPSMTKELRDAKQTIAQAQQISTAKMASGEGAGIQQANPAPSQPTSASSAQIAFASTEELTTKGANPPALESVNVPNTEAHRRDARFTATGAPTLAAQTTTATGLSTPVLGSNIQVSGSRSLPNTTFEQTVGEPDTFTSFSSHPLRDLAPHGAHSAVGHAYGRPELARHVALQVAKATSAHPDGQVELRLNPEELGRVRITMKAGDGTMVVSINAERGETLDLMRRHINLLAEEFQDLGYRDLQFDFGTSHGEENPKNSANPEIDDPIFAQVETVSNTNPHASEAHRVSGGIDLRF